MAFKSIKPEELSENPFQMIGAEWMLVTAGTLDSYNMMTASWGGLGVLWHKPVAICFARPQRYTREFLERESSFTLSFFGLGLRDQLALCGTQSGRDINKMAVDGLTPFATPAGSVAFREATVVLDCRKIYFGDILPEGFLSPDIAECYPDKDYHRMYIGEVSECFVAEHAAD